MNADAHTNVFIVHTHPLSLNIYEQIGTYTNTHCYVSFRDGGEILSFSTSCSGQSRQEHIQTRAHTHARTHITVCDLSQCHASTDSIRGEPLFFFLSVVLFSYSFSQTHAHTHSCTHTHTHNLAFVSRLEPNNFSLNVPIALLWN